MPADRLHKYVVEFDDPQALESSLVGSKAASVADLLRSGVAEEIARLLGPVDTDNTASANDASASIIELLASLTPPEGLAAEVARRIDSASSTFAVRSSATAEDLEGASFAGMYDTFLDAIDADSVLVRIGDVWSSYYTGRAISYRQRMGIPHDSGSMAVLVMELIDADAGGVVFTCDPRDGKDQILVNAAPGLGEGVVSGTTSADSFIIDPVSFEITGRDVIDKDWMIVSGEGGKTNKVAVPAVRRSDPALSDGLLLAVARAASDTKKSAGDDRDIEFAVKDDDVHILQSRPVTTGTDGPPVESKFPMEWDNPSEAELYWTPAYLREPTLPLYIDFLIWSGEVEKRCVDATGQHMARRYLKKLFNGHLFAAEPAHDREEIDARLFRHHREGRRLVNKGTTYYYAKVEPLLLRQLTSLERERPVDSAPISELVTYLKTATLVAVDHETDLHWRGWAGLTEKEDDAARKLVAETIGISAIEGSDLTIALDHMTSRLVGRLVRMAALVQSDEWLSDVFEKRDYDAIFERGAGKRPAVRRFRTRFRSMLKTWGRRSGSGYGTAWRPTDPTWNIKPEIPLDSIGSYVRQDLDELNRRLADSKRRRETSTSDVRQKIGGDKKLRERFELELFKATQVIKMMENHNYLIEQCTIGEYREAVHRLGTALVRDGWIDVPDDVFFLRMAQLESAAAAGGYSGLRSLVIRAKDEFTENSKLTMPEYLGTKPPEKVKKDEGEKPLRGLSEDGSTLHGTASSRGSFTGVARVVVTRNSTPPNVQKGDILVAENAGPDWVPVFPLLGALVLDSGANFQHAALISREYGIPCVIQTQVATKQIANGQVIAVDGSTGTVVLNPLV
jgi:pyruvate,water dikinase